MQSVSWMYSMSQRLLTKLLSIERQITDRSCWNYDVVHFSFSKIHPIGNRQLPATHIWLVMLQMNYVIANFMKTVYIYLKFYCREYLRCSHLLLSPSVPLKIKRYNKKIKLCAIPLEYKKIYILYFLQCVRKQMNMVIIYFWKWITTICYPR